MTLIGLQNSVLPPREVSLTSESVKGRQPRLVPLAPVLLQPQTMRLMTRVTCVKNQVMG